MIKRLVSGIQPSGMMHIGNYIGALKQCQALQAITDELFLFVADLHAMTTPYRPCDLKKFTYQTIAAYIACGLDPEKSCLFSQSAVPAHSHLGWILGTLVPMGSLDRMTQFKDKKNKRTIVFSGLYTYPTLMAADILIYQMPGVSVSVPVGEDQQQHLEFCRDLAMRVNNFLGYDFWGLPQALFVEEGRRIMSLQDGTKKMSKSDPASSSCLYLMDSDDEIALKIRKAKTDSWLLASAPSEMVQRPEALNLLTCLAALEGHALEKVCGVYAGKTFSSLKKDLTDAAIACISPIRNRIAYLMTQQDFLKQIMQHNAEKAIAITNRQMQRIHEVFGLYPWKISH